MIRSEKDFLREPQSDCVEKLGGGVFFEMSTSSTDKFLHASIPRFDGHYDHWSMLMENVLKSKEYWNLEDEGIPAVTEAQRKTVDEAKLKDLKVKNFLFQAIDREIMVTILDKGTSKAIWDSMKQKYPGSTKVRRAQLQALRREFKLLEESNDLTTMSIDELHGSLLVHEQRMQGYQEDEQVLKIANEGRFGGRGEQKFGGRARGSFRGRGRGRGYTKDLEKNAQYAELDENEEMLLMSYVKENDARRESVWFLDSGCTNHMCATKEWLSDFDEKFRQSVRLGDNSKMMVVRKGNIKLEIDGLTQRSEEEQKKDILEGGDEEEESEEIQTGDEEEVAKGLDSITPTSSVREISVQAPASPV
ncbi:uncharacterized protein LOC112194649 [Rosa chinensis]|uniref:uncharacterized protein LOC112194649 n=1 Tax=Rosa chinensis TaxID=74649 RepID=UPI000D08B431|nr:uncharacterized protein LOC112194649 [Rosa chinensis]